MLKEAGVDNSFAKKKVSEWNAKAQDFTNKTGIPRQEAREKVFTSGGKSDIIETQGFASKKLLDKHLDKHLKEYENFSSDAYVARAIELLNHPVDANVKGFTGSNLKVYRYDISNNDFAVKNKNGTIATLFKPEQGLTYWERQEKKYGSS